MPPKRYECDLQEVTVSSRLEEWMREHANIMASADSGHAVRFGADDVCKSATSSGGRCARVGWFIRSFATNENPCKNCVFFAVGRLAIKLKC